MQDQPQNIFYVYAHRRATDGSIFYIGKGKGFRASNVSSRNIHWRRIVKKHDYRIEFVKKEMDEKSAFELEEHLICELRLSGFTLANITNGGEGESGRIITDEAKAKMKEAKLGKAQSPEHAAKSAISRLGHKNSKESTEKSAAKRRRPIINSDGEIFDSANHAKIELEKRMGRKIGALSISACARGDKPSAYGLSWSYDTTKTPECRIFGHRRPIGIVGSDFVFESVTSAADWVRSWRGSANFQTICVSTSSASKSAYGYKWFYLDSIERE